MGANESTLSGLEGYQIVRVIHNSPAHVAGLVAFFDFITAVDKLPLDRDNPGFFFDYVRRNKDKAITCQVFNLRVRASRDVTVVPSDCWGGVGLLGCNVCWEGAETALESTWHIVDVVPDSPAYRADLMAHRDFILGMQPAHDGSSITTFRDGSDFHSRFDEWRARMAVANRSSPRTLLVMVFDSVENSVKEVLLDMTSSNSLGVDVANGYLHVVPPTPNSDKLPVMRRFVRLGADRSAAAPEKAAAHTEENGDASALEPAQGEAAPAFPAPPSLSPASQPTQPEAAQPARPPSPPAPQPTQPETPADAVAPPAAHAAATPSKQPGSEATPARPAVAATSPFPQPRQSGPYSAPAFPMPPARQ